ncbi:S-adenosylmethionine:tRNA ribosyltransferase-isomerase, partial [Amylibacter sp.]|nr:S-adenosylmethionine:tRNA ribosyltransferase-isomerase [Amylibacter sp.]
ALIGTEKLKNVYLHAINNRYRFFSYGDASLLLP